MIKIPFEDGTKISNAKVTIDETDYIVTPAQYSGTTPLTAANLNLMQDNIEDAINNKNIDLGSYTKVEGTYTTAAWSTGTVTNCTWTAPKTGLYIIFSRFDLADDSKAQIYKQLQLKGTATRIIGDLLLYQAGPTTATSSHLGISIFTGATLVYAQQGQTIIPYIHTPEAGLVWDVKILGMFIK